MASKHWLYLDTIKKAVSIHFQRCNTLTDTFIHGAKKTDSDYAKKQNEYAKALKTEDESLKLVCTAALKVFLRRDS